MYERHTTEVEDFTRPFLVMAFVNLFSGFFVIWAIFGLPVVLFLAALLNLGIGRIQRS
ncbi:hypothetical protein [Maritimibacter sp. 55A14]|uniref:hypothetical protein n=1 Tax=Maritimibacter sp. 55A14 TaxID=2174844 RepID=UPI0018EE539C|nr:hypothetical protein [Maritimibacter sp. 55A14]